MKSGNSWADNRVADRCAHGGSSFDPMGNVIQPLVARGENISRYLTEAFWNEVGSIERYERLSNHEIRDKLEYLL